MIRLDGGMYTLRDNNNGEIPNVDNKLQHKGTIDYFTGEIDLIFNEPPIDDLVIDYVHNTTNVAVYKNLNTFDFYFDTTSLKVDDIQEIE